MKISVRRKDFADALRLACAAIPGGRCAKPVLQWVKLQARPALLTISATDLDLALHRTIDHDTQAAGIVVVEAKPLYATVHKLKGDVLAMEADGHSLHVRSTGATLSFPLQALAEYPSSTEFAGSDVVRVEAGSLQRMIGQTIFATAREDSRYAITGALIEATSRTVKLVATDGRQMALSTSRVCGRDIPRDGFLPAILPFKALNLLAKIKLPANAVVDVDVWPSAGKSRTIGFRAENFVVTAVVVDAAFPSYADVIPRTTDKRAELPVADLIEALQTVDMATSPESKGCRFSFAENVLTLTVEQDGMTVATARLPIRYAGPAAEIGFNPCHVLDVLKACGAESIDFAWNDPNRPGLFTIGEPNSVDHYCYVLMPVRLAERAIVVAA